MFTATNKPLPAGYDEFTDRAYAALGLCPFDHDTDRWHAFHGYIENAMQLDSWKFYADFSVQELVGAASEADLER
jgi:hypothetical protein